jgi:hypothetical protein
MGNRGHTKQGSEQDGEPEIRVPSPSASYRRRAWIEFQRALDPLAPAKPLARRRRDSDSSQPSNSKLS